MANSCKCTKLSKCLKTNFLRKFSGTYKLERAKIQPQYHYAEQHSSTFVNALPLVTSKTDRESGVMPLSHRTTLAMRLQCDASAIMTRYTQTSHIERGLLRLFAPCTASVQENHNSSTHESKHT